MQSLQTDRLILREPRETDCGAILKIRNTPFVFQYNAMVPRTEAEMLKEIRDSRHNTYYLEQRESHELAGAVFLSEDSMRYRVNATQLEYYLGEEFSQKGYMTEALRAIIPLLFEQGNEVVSARVFSPNIASTRLLEKLGFQKEGCIRHCVLGSGGIIFDDLIFSLLKSEYIRY